MKRIGTVWGLACAGAVATAGAAAAFDFEAFVEQQFAAHSLPLLGVGSPSRAWRSTRAASCTTATRTGR